jgi:hypothetical protein
MANSITQQHMLGLIDQLEQDIRHDSYHLNMDAQDALFTRLQAFKDLVNEKYRRVNEIVDIW